MFVFAPSEKEYVRNALLHGLRTDGRSPTQRRPTQLKTGVLDNLAGSCYVCIEHGKTEIYTGVKVKISRCGEGESPVNQVVVEISSMRRLSSEMEDCLAYLQQLLQEHFINKELRNFAQLHIPNSRTHFLEMHIQTFILSEPHLSLLEALFLSAQAALSTTSLPQLECFTNQVTGEETVELTPLSAPLALSAIDTILLVGCYEGRFLLDLSPLEFDSLDAVYLLAIRDGVVVSFESLKGAIASQEIHKVCSFALGSLSK
jgi:exosome complex RNA-binding protein Rrp42 (RNase PH superfamily)